MALSRAVFPLVHLVSFIIYRKTMKQAALHTDVHRHSSKYWHRFKPLQIRKVVFDIVYIVEKMMFEVIVAIKLWSTLRSVSITIMTESMTFRNSSVSCKVVCWRLKYTIYGMLGLPISSLVSPSRSTHLQCRKPQRYSCLDRTCGLPSWV